MRYNRQIVLPNFEQTNLQRQVLQGEADVGLNKCLSAKASLEKLNSDIKIHVIQKRLACDDYVEHIKGKGCLLINCITELGFDALKVQEIDCHYIDRLQSIAFE
jgi:molybdopterin/thiamine biosynthesis adenylyltransferase